MKVKIESGIPVNNKCTHCVSGMVPLWLFTLGPLLYSHTSIRIPYQNILYSLMGLVIPVGIGLLIKHKRPRWAEVMVTVSKVLMVVFLIFVLTVGVYANIYIFRLMTLQVRERWFQWCSSPSVRCD